MALDVSGQYRYPSPNPAWLTQRVEEVIAPELPIIDPHHHLWIEDGAPYLGAEIMADLASGHRIESTVFVQAHYGYRSDLPPELAPVGETEKVRAISIECAAAECPTRVAEGIVAFADLTRGDAAKEVIAAHLVAAQGALRGIRHGVSRDSHFPNGIVLRPAPAGLLQEESYRAGLRAVRDAGLSYDAMLYHQQLGELTDLARAMPDLPIVLDHMGTMLGVGPYESRRDETFAEWRRDMAELAECENVTVKLGGLGMIITGARWHERPAPPSSQELAEAWRPQIETGIELFGTQRCMFESNFPVDKAMYSYRTLWNAFKRLTVAASPAEREALFAGTAAKTYRLAMPQAQVSKEMIDG